MSKSELKSRLCSWIADLSLAAAFYLTLSLAAIYILGLQSEPGGATPIIISLTVMTLAISIWLNRLGSTRATKSIPHSSGPEHHGPGKPRSPSITASAILVVGILLNSSVANAELTVEGAYQAIPHRRTPFDASKATASGIPEAEAAYLSSMFALIDRAIVLRITNSRALATPDTYRGTQAEIQATTPPTRLERFHSLVASAIEKHRRYFQHAARNEPGQQPPLISSSSADLHAAYAELINLYGSQPSLGSNRDAFFDYLCALDFV